jgi:hypothetical protein
MKADAEKEGNEGRRTVAKLFLNALSGKFAQNLSSVENYLYGMVDNRLTHIHKYQTIDQKGLFAPISSCILAWGRNDLAIVMDALKDYFIYCDTDSCHVESPEICRDILNNIGKLGGELGDWEEEDTALRSKYVGKKTYVKEVERHKYKFKCVGVKPDDILNKDLSKEWGHDPLTYFGIGAEYETLKFKRGIGGKYAEIMDYKVRRL